MWYLKRMIWFGYPNLTVRTSGTYAHAPLSALKDVIYLIIICPLQKCYVMRAARLQNFFHICTSLRNGDVDSFLICCNERACARLSKARRRYLSDKKLVRDVVRKTTLSQRQKRRNKQMNWSGFILLTSGKKIALAYGKNITEFVPRHTHSFSRGLILRSKNCAISPHRTHAYISIQTQ